MRNIFVITIFYSLSCLPKIIFIINSQNLDKRISVENSEFLSGYEISLYGEGQYYLNFHLYDLHNNKIDVSKINDINFSVNNHKIFIERIEDNFYGTHFQVAKDHHQYLKDNKINSFELNVNVDENEIKFKLLP